MQVPKVDKSNCSKNDKRANRRYFRHLYEYKPCMLQLNIGCDQFRNAGDEVNNCSEQVGFRTRRSTSQHKTCVQCTTQNVCTMHLKQAVRTWKFERDTHVKLKNKSMF